MQTTLYSNLSQIDIKPITQDTYILNGYVVEFRDIHKDQLMNER